MDKPPPVCGQPVGVTQATSASSRNVSHPSLTIQRMEPTGETRLLTGRQVCDLLHIDRSTLHKWRLDGAITGFRPIARRGVHWRYPADQPALTEALAAVRDRTVTTP